MKYRYKTAVRNLIFYASLLMTVFVVGFPLYWMLVTSFTPADMVFDTPPNIIPTKFSLQNYVQLFEGTVFPEYLKNSLMVVVGVVGVTTLFSSLAGYTLKRYDFPQKKNVARLVLFSYMFPGMLRAIPLFITFKSIGLLDTYWGLILAQTSEALPFGIWLMWLFFQTIPNRFEECARTLGAGRFRSIFQVAMRMALPGVIATAIFSFAVSWGDYIYVKCLTANFRTIPLGLGMFMEQAYIHWGLIQAGSTIAFIPPIILVIFLQKYILAGFSLRGV